MPLPAVADAYRTLDPELRSVNPADSVSDVKNRGGSALYIVEWEVKVAGAQHLTPTGMKGGMS